MVRVGTEAELSINKKLLHYKDLVDENTGLQQTSTGIDFELATIAIRITLETADFNKFQ
jgi:hypothetical protein